MFRWLKRLRTERQIATIRAFEAQLEDQVRSGQVALRQWRAKRERLELDLAGELTPDEIVRRAGAGA